MQCVVTGCENDSTQTCQEITYHIFPTEPSLRAAWLAALHMTGWEPIENSAVCSKHFQREDLLETSSERRVIRPGAAPVVDLLICRICFATDCKLYSMMSYKNLSKAYETLTGLLVKKEANIPPNVCSECARQLLNNARFRSISLRAHMILLEIVKKHDFMTPQLIKSVKEIPSPLGSNDFDYDLDTELAKKENMYSDELTNLTQILGLGDDSETGFMPHVAVDNIKVELDDITNQDICNDEGVTNNDITSKLPEDIAKDGIKVEEDDIINQETNDVGLSNHVTVNMSKLLENIVENNIKVEEVDVNHEICNAEGVTNDDTASISNLPENIVENNIKVEEVDINHEICNAEGVSNVTICISKLSEDTIESVVKVENDDVITQDTHDVEDVRSDQLECGNVVAEGRRKRKLRNTRVHKGKKIKKKNSPRAELDMRPEREVDGGLLANNELYCDVCPYRTNSELQLSTHLKAHSAPVSYRCNKCTYITIYKSDLRIHLKSHSGKKPFSCYICNKTFKQKPNLIRHMMIHSGEKPFSCNICNKAFTRKAHVITHVMSHSGVKPFSCNVCNKGFSRKAQVKSHMIVHSDEKPFRCNICNKAFNDKYHAKRHLIIHSGEKPFSCYICDKAFNDKQHLKRHLITHSAAKPFTCYICNKAFNDKQLVKRHMVTHSAAKPLSCDICDKVFYDKYHVKRHMIIHYEE